jgi:MoaA/NifB/PqqE/SkfB family radical SAM enzyme
MKRHSLRNSGATLLEDDRALLVESPEGGRYPVDMGVLSLTSRCNLSCVMCLEPRNQGAPDLPLAEAMGFVEVFAGRVPTIWSCAGEALLHPQFYDIAAAAFRRGTRLGIGTNGLVLSSRRLLQRCAVAGVRWLHISCHTSRPRVFADLTASTGRRRFDRFVRGLRNVDAWNRDHEPERRFDVLLQLVLMRPFADELEEYLDFVGQNLSHSPLVIRVEPMQPMNAGRDHPELQLDLAEVGRIVRTLIAEHSRRFTFEFKSIPLCLLDGAEGLSEDLRKRALGTVVVGNLGRHSAGLQLQCPIGDPESSAFAATCARCRLVNLCPGVMENPVPAGCPWPRASSASAVELLARLGLRTDFAEHKFDLVYPRLSTAPDPDAPESLAPQGVGGGPRPEGVLGSMSAEQLGLDPGSRRRFTTEQLERIAEIVGGLERDSGVAESHVSDAFAALCLRVPDRAPGPCVVILEPAGPATRCCFAEGGVAVRYNGEMTPGLQAHLDRIRRLLAAGAGTELAGRAPPELSRPRAAAGGCRRSDPRTGRGRKRGPRGRGTRARRSGRSSRRGR